MAKGYHSEVKWRDERYVPSSIEEHLQMSTRSSGCMHIANMAFILLGATTEAVEWAFTFPKIITAVCIVGRVANDITSHEVNTISSIFTRLSNAHVLDKSHLIKLFYYHS